MLITAPTAHYANLDLVNNTLISVIFGTVRNVFERSMPAKLQVDIRDQLVAMCLSYVEGVGG